MPQKILRRIPLLFLLPLLLSGCRNDAPEEDRPAGASDTTAVAPAAIPGTDSSLVTDSGSVATNAVTGASASPVAPSVRTALVDSVRTFMTAVESGRSERFWQMLSDRSLRAVGTESGGTREQIWEAARETLTGIDRPTIQFLGGTSDSVSLIVSRTTYEKIDSVRTDTLEDPVIIHFLKEQGKWKAIYPGLLYPERDRRRR